MVVARHERVTIDVGTGDGRAGLAAAAREPGLLVIGLDAEAPSMAESSRRAARPAHRGGLTNALFVVAAAEAVPDELRGIAGLVTVRFPWGSLLRGCLGADESVAAGIASLVIAGGALELVLAPAGRDRLDGLPIEPAEVVAAAKAALEPFGLAVVEGREATAEEIRASGSSWARRLLGATGRASPERRPVLVRLRSP
jgi:16S rRNA (adenine(1408)-N(1))-methyltransferase